jgi:hypothetical protein
MAGETLNITGGNAAGQNITLDQELVIGRSTPGLGSLGGDSEISRVHARVFHDPSGRLIVEDLGSTNGTFVNGQRLTGQQALNPGDQVRVGQTTMAVAPAAGPGATTVGNIVPPPAAAVPPPPAAVAAEPPTQQLPPQQPYGQPPAAPPPPGYGGGPIGGPPQASGGGSNRNLLIALAALVIIALVVAGLAIGGVFGGSDKKSSATTAQTTPTTATPTQTAPPVAMPAPPTTNTQPSPAPGGYPPGFRAKFVDSCASGGAPRAICGCTFDKLKSRYSFTEFVGLLGKVKNGNLPPPIQSAVRQCAQA